MSMMPQDPASSRRCGAETNSTPDVGSPVDDGSEHNKYRKICRCEWLSGIIEFVQVVNLGFQMENKKCH